MIAAQQKYGFDEPPMIVSYVHNLAYEFQFLAGVYEFKNEQCFFAKPRKPIYCRCFDSIEYRCSYKLSNMTLAKYAQTLGAKTQKLSGAEFDYQKIRYPWTELTDYEKQYCINDVVSLVDCISIELKKGGDDLHTIPLTSTGFVRRECKAALQDCRRWLIEPMMPNVEQYKLLRAAFRGGNTHAAALTGYVGAVLDDVVSYDMSSCYPAQQLTKKFPMKPFKWLPVPVKLEQVAHFIKSGYAVVAEYVFFDLELKNHKTPVPYLSLSKTNSSGFRCDNGRVISAERCETVLTEIDQQIVRKQYNYSKIAITKCMVAKKDYLPEKYLQVIRGYYRYKTTMKRQAAQNDDVAYLYMKTKNKLNGVYGMSAQDPIHANITFEGGKFYQSGYDNKKSVKALKTAPFPYQWGVYTTAYARAALQQGIDYAGDSVCYCDTDSIKTVRDVDYTTINAERQALAESRGAFADDSAGIRHYMGVYEPDGNYERFITQGAKRYAYESGGKIHIVVSGVTHVKNPQTGNEYCIEQLGDLSKFAPPMKWEKAGGTTAVYNDNDDFDYTDPETGLSVHVGRNVAIVNTTYEMKYEKDYGALLQELILYHDWKVKTE